MENEQTPQQEEKKGVHKGVVVLLIILILGLGAVSFLFYNKVQDLEAQIANQTTTIEDNEDEINGLTGDLEDKIKEYETLREEYEELGLSYEELDAQINDLKSEVQKYKSANWANAKEKNKLKKELELVIAKHQLALDEKDKEIERYKLLADSLATSVDSLLVEQGMASEKINDLASKVEMASILKAENLKVFAYNDKDKEYDGNEFKSKRTAKLKVVFNFGENKVAKHEEKDIIFRLVQPDGSVAFDLASGGGSFTDSAGVTDFYTSRKMVKFTNSQQEVEFFYAVSEEDPLAEGDYLVTLYANGYKIGQTSFKIDDSGLF